jgi:hypothetical protein
MLSLLPLTDFLEILTLLQQSRQEAEISTGLSDPRNQRKKELLSKKRFGDGMAATL